MYQIFPRGKQGYNAIMKEWHDFSRTIMSLKQEEKAGPADYQPFFLWFRLFQVRG